MGTKEPRTLSRDVEVAAIPYGDKMTLTAGTIVYITQSLGGSYTVMTDHGYQVRVEGKDSDAIGEQPTKPLTAKGVAGRSTEEMAWDQLKTVFDPEIPVNIVDLGLVYQCQVEPLEDGKEKVKVQFKVQNEHGGRLGLTGGQHAQQVRQNAFSAPQGSDGPNFQGRTAVNQFGPGAGLQRNHPFLVATQ